jgi:hypothetical protein
VLEDEYKSEPSSEDESDCCEVGFMKSLGVLADGSLRMEYNDVELRQLKAIHVEVPSVPNSWILIWLIKQYVTLV